MHLERSLAHSYGQEAREAKTAERSASTDRVGEQKQD